eukprot:gene12954-7530_t
MYNQDEVIEDENTIKITIFGVGKSCFISRFIQDKFDEKETNLKTSSVIIFHYNGEDSFLKITEVPENVENIELESLMSKADAMIFCYDILNYGSLTDLEKLINVAQQKKSNTAQVP